ncbi:Cys or Met metabolism pyridoxal-phosphate-dependent enzyme [Klebsormidium nitens]|uniref:Cys or Met metabolism pyridoxal-phosphate-dependent enzyme n=1 Tax=Klebsormidium nitens TaxID=105231 RepID=A0A1Y1HM96_KLENI|nr:Cys or Met metabolism pyridoxal-phosphate-dependent enzyme [Klebsormidium nitens]|eukprot:GAQ79730.1 Cys or Met metabolism pyridoxal-phosphate-dependent enzyme [Klebsormidium nitens]
MAEVDTDEAESSPHNEPFADYISDAVDKLRPQFEQVDRTVAVNLRRVLDAYREARVGSHHLTGATGYGHNDAGGREALDTAFARIVGAEAAIVRSQFFSGTHAIAAALFAVLRPGDELLAVAGAPYDTLEEVIGLRGTPGHGSLAEFGVSYRVLPLTPGEKLDFAALETAVGSGTKCALIQRSCGYSWRETLTMEEIERAVNIIKRQNPKCAVVVDNCYGEFVDIKEPTAVGADLIAGSLIKNPGGSIAPGGGYVAGREDLVDAAAARLSAPGIGRDAGATPSSVQRLMLQGLFLAPQIVGEAVKSSLLLAEVLSAEGFATKPAPRARRHDIIQAVQLGSREKLLAFCQAVQTMCPVGAYIRPTAGATAGYESEVVFADGTFIDGSTIELSCDGPLREPFVVYCQGGTHWTHWAIALEAAVTAMRALGR